jgi:hypothetical protein
VPEAVQAVVALVAVAILTVAVIVWAVAFVAPARSSVFRPERSVGRAAKDWVLRSTEQPVPLRQVFHNSDKNAPAPQGAYYSSYNSLQPPFYALLLSFYCLLTGAYGIEYMLFFVRNL